MEDSARRAVRAGRNLKKSGRNKRRKGGGFGARYKPPKAGEPLIPMLLFRGLYKVQLTLPDGSVRVDELDYDIRCEHFSAKANTGLTCTAGLEEDDEGFIGAGSKPCVPCTITRDEGKGSISFARKIHIINGILLADFHMADSDRKVMKDGKPTGELYKEYAPCLGRRCTHCKQGIETTFGRAVFMPLGTNFIQQLADFDLITLASECLCGGTLEPVGFVCAHCDMEFVDFEKDDVDDKGLQQLREEEFRCKHCGKTDYLLEVSVCDKCADPKPLTMWTTVMELYRSGDGTSTSLQINKYRPVTPEELDRVKELMMPVDTDKMYPHLTPTEQAKKFNVPLPDEFAAERKGSTQWDD